MKKSGRILIVAELAREYGFKDVGGMLEYLVSILASLYEPWFLFWWDADNSKYPLLINRVILQ